MTELEQGICELLRRHFRCSCGLKPPYCICVAELVNLTLEKCEEEVEEDPTNG